jgi:hypothetical protein
MTKRRTVPLARPPYRVSELARKWDVDNRTVIRAIKGGQLFAWRMNRMYLIDAASADRLSGEAASDA